MSRLLVSLDDYGLPPVPARRVAGFANKVRARNASADFGRTLAESAVFGNGRIPAGFNERVNGRIDKKFTPSYLSRRV